jgi:hypothetical protein
MHLFGSDYSDGAIGSAIKAIEYNLAKNASRDNTDSLLTNSIRSIRSLESNKSFFTKDITSNEESISPKLRSTSRLEDDYKRKKNDQVQFYDGIYEGKYLLNSTVLL